MNAENVSTSSFPLRGEGKVPCGQLVIAGTASGVGKTSLTLGFARALCRRALRVQALKVGPDFLDPTYLSRATRRTCYNLDGWMTDRRYVQNLFDRVTADADVALIEGVMGLFDGADPATLAGSTAEIAHWLDAPILLVVDAHGLARTLAAVVKGCVEFEPKIRIAGVIANRTGSAKHGEWLAESLRTAGLPPLVGAVPRGAFDALESRHLGLVTADRTLVPDERLEQLADACEQYVDIDTIVSLARGVVEKIAMPDEPQDLPSRSVRSVRPVRIGVARDEAFHFCYPDNLEALERNGAEVVPFSPIADPALPPGLCGVYLPGGYPELHAEALAANRAMLDAIRCFAKSGKCLYAECGGLMYLGRAMEPLDGDRLTMAGVLPIVTRMLDRIKSLGYVEVTLQHDTLWGTAGTTLRGHEFHYSEIIEEPTVDGAMVENHVPDTTWRKIYSIRHRRTKTEQLAGFQKGNVLAGYPHLHWASRPEVAKYFVQQSEKVA